MYEWILVNGENAVKEGGWGRGGGGGGGWVGVGEVGVGGLGSVGLGSGSRALRSEGCSWFEITLKVL